jgi:N-carbamoyl-L-amino-acid hydrolase
VRDGRVRASQPQFAQHDPGRVFFTVDLRHPYDTVLSTMDDELRQACAAAAGPIGLEVEVKEFWHFPATPFDPASSQRSAILPRA